MIDLIVCEIQSNQVKSNIEDGFYGDEQVFLTTEHLEAAQHFSLKLLYLVVLWKLCMHIIPL